jgi:transposase-like protein
MARARYWHASLKNRIGHPDSKAANFLRTVKVVLPVAVCPQCHRKGKRNIKKHTPTAAGTPRWRCKNCGKTWSRERSIYDQKCVPHSKLTVCEARRLYRSFLNLNNKSKVARRYRVSVHHVRIAVDYCESHPSVSTTPSTQLPAHIRARLNEMSAQRRERVARNVTRARGKTRRTVRPRRWSKLSPKSRRSTSRR